MPRLIEHDDLTWMSAPERSSCGCVFRRCREYGDIVVEQCDAHTTDPVRGTLTDVACLAMSFVGGGVTEDEAQRRLAELATRHGPANVRTIDAYFDSEVVRLRSGQERRH